MRGANTRCERRRPVRVRGNDGLGVPADRYPVIPAGAKRRAGTHAWVRLRLGPDSVAIRLPLDSRIRGNDGISTRVAPTTYCRRAEGTGESRDRSAEHTPRNVAPRSRTLVSLRNPRSTQ